MHRSRGLWFKSYRTCLEERDNEVSSGQDSTVVYEVWSSERRYKRSTDSEYLKEIWDYNKDDCVSLISLSDWLRLFKKRRYFYFFRAKNRVERIDASNLLDELVQTYQRKMKNLMPGSWQIYVFTIKRK